MYIIEIGVSVIKPFHLSLVVPDLEKVRVFYVGLLGCEVGRDTGKWIDILFFGHQLTLHQEGDGVIANPIDHFGPVLEKKEWQKISDLLKENSVAFEVEPFVKGKNTESEAGKFLVKDPAGNSLEFKYYDKFSETVAVKNA